MKNELQIFNSKEFGDVRIIDIEGTLHFIAKDVSKALGYKRQNDAIKQHCRSTVKHSIPHPQSKTKFMKVNAIPEADVYRLIMGSELASAIKFEEWVFEEVLPTIRKTGGIVTNTDLFVDSMFSDLPEDAKLIMKQAFKQREKDMITIKDQGELIDKQAPKVFFADAIAGAKTNITIGELAKLLNQNGYKTGQNRLFKELRAFGFIMNSKNQNVSRTPTQLAVELGVLALHESHVTVGKDDKQKTILTRTTRVTPKGQQYFIKKLCPTK